MSIDWILYVNEFIADYLDEKRVLVNEYSDRLTSNEKIME